MKKQNYGEVIFNPYRQHQAMLLPHISDEFIPDHQCYKNLTIGKNILTNR
jgi:hypothetical protein